MTPGISRPRSSTSESASCPRPVSRASTTSMNTCTEQPPHRYRHESEPHYTPPAQLARNQLPPYATVDFIPGDKQQLATDHEAYAIDPSLQERARQERAKSTENAQYTFPEGSHLLIDRYPSIEGKESQSFAAINERQTQGGIGEGDVLKKPVKGNASSQANDLELRRLFAENKHRDLQDVAASVLANERGPKSEKTKQIFAMNWLSTVCRTASSSVTRQRVYAHYATRCGNERVPLLNPASFGKLVRIIFPNIQTRRLGVRGESKYHYVELALIDDQPEVNDGERAQPSRGGEPAGGLSFRRSQLPPDTAVFPPPDAPFDCDPSRQVQDHIDAPGFLYLDHGHSSVHQGPSRVNMISRRLKFPIEEETSADDSPFELPSLQGYAPPGADADALNALKALYFSHCISIIDCIRFCRTKSFWHHFTSLHGTLTLPVQKLFAHPDLAAWIRECDWRLYQKMIRFVAPLALQVMPDRVQAMFESIRDRLGPHILQTFANHPSHVRDAKYGPAVIFAGLMGRLLRVNSAAHAAAHTLGNQANRDQMWFDWVLCVKPTVVAETSLPGNGYTRTVQILTHEVRELLGPLSATTYPGMQRIFIDTAATNKRNIFTSTDLDDSSTSALLERWIKFLRSLPDRFPGVNARTLLHCVSEVGTSALRDITMAQAISFGSWTVTKVWVDEMMQWLAEQGGFLERAPSSMELRPQKRSASEAVLDMYDDQGAHKESRSRTAQPGRPNRYEDVDTPGAFRREETVDLLREEDDFPQRRHPNRTLGEYNQSRPISSQSFGQEPTMIYARVPAEQQELSPISVDQGDDQRRTLSQATNLNHGSSESSRVDVQRHAAGRNSLPPRESAKEMVVDNDDSGIGLDLDLPPQHNTPIRLADYGGFVKIGSDPANETVC